MKPAIYGEERLERIRANMLRFDVPRLKAKSVAICGYGPSLVRTWEKARECDAVLTVGGAHDFMIERGIYPQYHVECDPREERAEFLHHPRYDTTYCINSQCHPAVFEALAWNRVLMWHGFTDEDAKAQSELVQALQPGARLLAGGTVAGLRAIIVARELGFTQFDLHGIDCCYEGDAQWAGAHPGKRHKTVIVEVEGRAFETSDLMMQATDDFFMTMQMLPDCRFRVNGGGLLEERLKLYNRDPQKALSKDWWTPVNFRLRDAA